jgi:nicotinate-nucleotide adenylyltransferase
MEDLPQRICLFGGTFDPIHTAHLQIASEAADICGLTRVLFVPASRPPHKQEGRITPYEHRYRMVEIACRKYPKFEASRLEEGERFSYTIETIEHLKTLLPAATKLFFLIGADAFNEIHTWHRWRDLVCCVNFIVVSRPGIELHIPAGAHVKQIKEILLPISSTSIRERLAHGEPTPELPVAVRHYIDAHHLYEAAKENSNVN